MAARIISIADDVVTVINGGTFTVPDTVTAVRSFIPEFKLTDIKTLKVSVLPASQPEVIYARRQTMRDFIINIGVQKKTGNLTTDFDDLVELVEEINELFRFTKLPITEANWVASETDPIYDHDYGSEMNVFTSVLSLTFRDYLNV